MLKTIMRYNRFFHKKTQSDPAFLGYVMFGSMSSFLGADGIKFYETYGAEKYKKQCRNFYNLFKKSINN